MTEYLRSKMVVIIGPTSTGKTDLAFQLASNLQGELVAVDSRQVYVGLDIGTGKLPGSGKWEVRRGRGFWEIGGIRVWMYDVVDLNKQYSVADYVTGAIRVIGEIRERGKLPIVVGGTGLYIKALTEGLSFLQLPVDKKLREKLSNLSLTQLQKKLQKTAPKKWEIMNNSDRNNPRRLVRAVELSLASLRAKRSNLDMRLPQSAFGVPRNDIMKIGLIAPREILYEKINKRVYQWIEEGIIEEVKSLRKMRISKRRFRTLGLEYAVTVDYLDGKISMSEMIEKMQIKVRQYAKRQITWFKKGKDVIWFDVTKKDSVKQIENLVTKWYDKSKFYATED